MRAQIHPQQNLISIDDEPLTIANVPWPVLALEGFDASRLIEVIHFDGAIGMIQQRSRAPGRHDVTHFVGAEPIAAFATLHANHKAALAEAKARLNAEEEERARHAAECAEKADQAKKG